MALVRVLAGVKQGVLRHISIPALRSGLLASGAAGSVSIARGFAEGTYLNKNEVTDRILNIVKHFEKVEPAKVTPTSNFHSDLGLDSLDTVELVMAMEEEFCVEIPDSEADKILSVPDAISYIASHPQAK